LTCDIGIDVVTDSVEASLLPTSQLLEVVSVAGLFDEAIRRIASRESTSVLFK
jgi:phosphoribosylpyrophosphate synthetase